VDTKPTLPDDVPLTNHTDYLHFIALFIYLCPSPYSSQREKWVLDPSKEKLLDRSSFIL